MEAEFIDRLSPALVDLEQSPDETLYLEGTGAMVAYPILCAALAFMNEMASFESAGVSKNVR